MQRYFGGGRVRPDRSDRTVKWGTHKLSHLLLCVIPHFKTYPLMSGKQRDFELFADICERMASGSHLRVSGLRAIVALAGEMNPSGKRGYPPHVILQSLVEVKA